MTQSGNLYARSRNTTGGPLNGLQISYDVEKYRGGSNAAGFRIQLFYSTDGTTWTSAGADFLTAFGADAGNTGFASAPGATVSVTNQTLPAAIPNDATFYLAWNYSVSTGSTTSNAQALAVDNIAILGVGGGDPPPSDTAPFVTSDDPRQRRDQRRGRLPDRHQFQRERDGQLAAFSLVLAGAPQAFGQSASPATTFTLTPAAPLPYSTSCTVTVTANQVADTDGSTRRMLAGRRPSRS